MALKTNIKGDRPSRRHGFERVMRTTLIISLFFHVFALLVIHEAFPMDWFTRPTRTYNVELLRPPLDLLDETNGTDLASIKISSTTTILKSAPVEDSESLLN